ncbi:MAG: hypothetical protein H7281_15175 [Bacteriovorax sp.]|nr:hypothetical protein [Bacteriovorax sp.]
MKKCCDENKKASDTNLDLENLEGLICYCFKHSKKELYESVKNGREDQILNDIKAKMKNSGCFCDVSNPSGKCCLNDVLAFIEDVKNKL